MRATLQRWQTHGLAGLWEAKGRGAKAKWQASDIEFLEQCLAADARTYNSAQLAQKLAQQRQVSLSADRIRRILKKGYCWKRTRHRQRGKQDQELKRLKQADLDTLVLAAQDRHIALKYLDESGFCLSAPVSSSSSSSCRGEQKRLEQFKTTYGNRLSILGIWQPGQSFDYALVQGSFSKERYVKAMNWLTQKAAQHLFKGDTSQTAVIELTLILHL